MPQVIVVTPRMGHRSGSSIAGTRKSLGLGDSSRPSLPSTLGGAPPVLRSSQQDVRSDVTHTTLLTSCHLSEKLRPSRNLYVCPTGWHSLMPSADFQLSFV